jgi:hypothetical protein
MEVSGQLYAPTTLSPEKELQAPIGEKAGWVPESIWELWRREKSRTARNRTRAAQPVAIRYTDWAIPTPFSISNEIEVTDINQLWAD